jgi:hypothetical protein
MSATKWLKFTNQRLLTAWKPPAGEQPSPATVFAAFGTARPRSGSAVGVRREQNLDAATLVSGHQVARCRWAFLAENAHAIPAQSLIAKGIICEVRD